VRTVKQMPFVLISMTQVGLSQCESLENLTEVNTYLHSNQCDSSVIRRTEQKKVREDAKTGSFPLLTVEMA